jgi:hypothetical protein
MRDEKQYGLIQTKKFHFFLAIPRFTDPLSASSPARQDRTYLVSHNNKTRNTPLLFTPQLLFQNE